MSVYDEISAMFNGDALCIEVNGVRVHDVCAEKAVKCYPSGEGFCQWVFSDGTSIITYADQWLEADAAGLEDDSEPTIAEHIAGMLNNDGQLFTLGDFDLYDHCDEMSVRRLNSFRGIKWVFADGSALVACDGGWDLALHPENDTCFCFEGCREHDRECRAS